ncbi:MAG: hypothetical protein ACJAX7_002385, partial [Saprospiraceae bacterium]
RTNHFVWYLLIEALFFGPPPQKSFLLVTIKNTFLGIIELE